MKVLAYLWQCFQEIPFFYPRYRVIRLEEMIRKLSTAPTKTYFEHFSTPKSGQNEEPVKRVAQAASAFQKASCKKCQWP